MIYVDIYNWRRYIGYTIGYNGYINTKYEYKTLNIKYLNANQFII